MLVTGGAGFIGSHYVRTVLGDCWGLDAAGVGGRARQADIRRQHRRTSTAVLDDPRLRFVEGDILDRALVDDLMAEADAVVHFAAESHVDRSIIGRRRLRDDQRRRHPDAARLGAAARPRRSSCTSRPMRSTARSTTGRWDEEQPLEPNSPYSASKASSDLIARSYCRTHRLPVCVTRCSNNYGPLPVPGEGHPAVRHEPDRRWHGAAVRRGRQRPRLAARRRPLPRHPPGARRRPAGRGLQHRRRHRDDRTRS